MPNANTTKNRRNWPFLFGWLLLIHALPGVAQQDSALSKTNEQTKYVFPAHTQPYVHFSVKVVPPKTKEEKIEVEITQVTDLAHVAVLKHTWEISKEGKRIAYKEVEGEPKALLFSSVFSDVFAPCSEYEIKLFVHFALGNISTHEKEISTRPVVTVGLEEQICETLFPFALNDFTPIPERGFGTGPQQGLWTSHTEELRVSPNGGVTLGSSFDHKRVHKLTYQYRDLYGCLAKAEKNLFVTTVPKSPEVYVQGPVRVDKPFFLECKNSEYGNHLWTGPRKYTYEWYSTVMKRNYTPVAEGLYTVKIEWKGCTGPEDTVEVKLSPEKPEGCPPSDQVMSVSEAMQYERVGCLLTVKGFFQGYDPNGSREKLVRQDQDPLFVGALPAGPLSDNWPRKNFLCYVHTGKAKKLRQLKWDQEILLKGTPEVTNHEGWNEMSFFVKDLELKKKK